MVADGEQLGLSLGARWRCAPLAGPRYNVAPTRHAPVLLADGDGTALDLFRWGARECDRLFHAGHRYLRGALSRTELRKQIRPIRARFRRLLQCGAESESAKMAAMCRRLLRLWPALWSFLCDEALEAGVEPTGSPVHA